MRRRDEERISLEKRERERKRGRETKERKGMVDGETD